MLSINWNDIFTWMKGNQIILGLLASAIIITMPEKLPHWREFPEWMWEWVRDAMKTFMNFRHSGVPVTDEQHAKEKAMTTQDAMNKETLHVLPAVPVTPVVTDPQQLNG